MFRFATHQRLVSSVQRSAYPLSVIRYPLNGGSA